MILLIQDTKLLKQFIQVFHWSKFSGAKKTFWVSIWEKYRQTKETKDITTTFKGRCKRLRRYDLEKTFQSAHKKYIGTYKIIRKIATCQGDDYTTGWLRLDPYFKENYSLTAIKVSKQQAHNADSKAIQKTIFKGILKDATNTTIVFILK